MRPRAACFSLRISLILCLFEVHQCQFQFGIGFCPVRLCALMTRASSSSFIWRSSVAMFSGW